MINNQNVHHRKYNPQNSDVKTKDILWYLHLFSYNYYAWLMPTLRETGQLLRLKGMKWSFRKGTLFFKHDHTYISIGSGHIGAAYITGEFTTKHEARWCC